MPGTSSAQRSTQFPCKQRTPSHLVVQVIYAQTLIGAEADELRRAVGMRRSMERMKNLEGRLRAGMTRNRISPEAQDNIVLSISSFAMYGFPESHAASFALIAYASAYLKVHYLAASTCALLNNQPMGFYSPAVLIKDAQRHGLRVRSIDLQRSLAVCSLEQEEDHSISLRIGFNYAKGVRTAAIQELLNERALHGEFQSVEDLTVRVPALNSRELVQLARRGALNALDTVAHRRDALWQVERAGRPVGPLLRGMDESERGVMPLAAMTTSERLSADFAGIVRERPRASSFSRWKMKPVSPTSFSPPTFLNASG